MTSFSPIVTVSAVLAPVAGLAYAGFFVTKIGVLKSVGAFAGSALVVNYPIRYLMESVLDLNISALNMPHVISGSRRNMGTLANTHFVIGIIATILILGIATGLAIFLCKRKDVDKIPVPLSEVNGGAFCNVQVEIRYN